MSNQTTPAQAISYSGIIGDYQLLKKIGEGSYGEVWLAKGFTGSFRAVKVVFKKNFKTEAPFQREVSGIKRFEPISREHQGFVEIFHAGPNPPDDYFYYAMELADDVVTGQEIQPEKYQPKLLDEKQRLPASECIRIGMSLAEALEQLHRQKLCHRDIKPSNVIFVKGRPKLADIGLVGDLGPGASFVGTEGYVSPEGPGTPQADIYALGKLLYQISTGRPLADYPNLPADLEEIEDKGLFVELNEVILKACDRDAAKRYKSAGDLYADLLLITRGRSIKRLRLLEGRMRFIGKAAVVASIVTVIASGIGYHYFKERAFEARFAERQAGFHSANGVSLMQNGDWLSAFKSFTAALAASTGTAEQEELQRLRLGSLLAHSPKLAFVSAASKQVSYLEFDNSGGELLVGERFGAFWKVDLPSGRQSNPLRPKGTWLEMCVFSPDGQSVAVAGANSAPAIYNFKSQQTIIGTNKLPYTVCIQYAPGGEELATGHEDGTVRLWEAGTGVIKRTLSNHVANVFSVAYSKDGKLMASASADNFVKIHDRQTGRQLYSFEHPNWVYSVTFDNSNRVFTGCGDRQARAWNLLDGKQLLPEMPHKDIVRSIVVSKDVVATASFDGMVRLWNAENLLPLDGNNIFRHESKVTAVALNPGGNLLATGTERGVIRIWEFPDQNILSEIPELASFGTNCTESENVEFALFRKPLDSDTLEFTVVELEKRQAKWRFQAISNDFPAFALSNDGQTAAAAKGTEALVWKSAGGNFSISNQSPVKALALSRNGELIAISSSKNAQIWSVASKSFQTPTFSHTINVSGMAFWINDSILAVWCQDFQINRSALNLWDPVSGNALQTFSHNDGILNASISADFGKVATASEDFTGQVWDMETGKRLGNALEHGYQVTDAVFNPNGTMVATASEDKTILLWESVSGAPLSVPIHLKTTAKTLKFLDAETLFMRCKEGFFTAKLPKTTIPIADLQEIASLASPVLQQDLTASDVAKIWRKLKEKHPSTFK